MVLVPEAIVISVVVCVRGYSPLSRSPVVVVVVPSGSVVLSETLETSVVFVRVLVLFLPLRAMMQLAGLTCVPSLSPAEKPIYEALVLPPKFCESE